MPYQPSREFNFVQQDYAPSRLFAFVPEVELYGNGSVGLSGTASLFVFPPVVRYLTSDINSTFDQASQVSAAVCSPVESTVLLSAEAASTCENATSLSAEVCAVVKQSPALNKPVCVAFNAPIPILAEIKSDISPVYPLNKQLCSTMAGCLMVTQSTEAVIDAVEFITRDFQSAHEDSTKAPHIFTRIGYINSTVAFSVSRNFSFTEQAYPTSRTFAFDYNAVPIEMVDDIQKGLVSSGKCSPFQSANKLFKVTCSTFEMAMQPPPGQSIIGVDPPRDPPPVPPVIYTIPVRQTYMINHVVTVTLLDLTPVSMEQLSLSIDADAFAWSFRGTLAKAADIDLIRQPMNGDPVQLLITVNGVVFKMLVETIDHNRQFGQRSISVSGRSLSALLGQPYYRPQSATQASTLTVQQIADLQLPVGWTLDWQMPSAWLVPSGAFTYTNQTPIQVLMGIAQSIGAILKPHRSEKILTMMPRYKVGPWQYATAVADLNVPESAILSATLRPPVPIDINGVYVHGGEIGGVIGWCRLTGSDGAKLAQTQSNALVTHVDGARALGTRVLAAHQPQPAIQSVTIPFDNDDFPLAEEGWLVSITENGVPAKGIINAVSLDVSFGSIRQTITVGEQTPNDWTLFKTLLPQDPLLVGTLSSTDGTTSLITLLDGGVVRVRGTGTVGAKHYIRSGKIDGTAPNLSNFEIVI